VSGSRRGAPNKKGLDYFPKMVAFYEDDKIFDLMDEYGPLGVTIYDIILTIVYENGYYVELSEDKLSRMVIRKIGSKWIKNRKAVVQVIHYCADLGLLCKDLLLRNVITSEGIQKRYHKIAVGLMKRQLYSDKYWLLGKEENGEPLLKSPSIRISSEENGINSEENQINSELKHTKRKERKYISIYYDTPELDRTFQLYIQMRNSQQTAQLSKDQIGALKEQLDSLSDNDEEKTAICRKAFVSGWKSFYPLKKASAEKAQPGPGRGSGKKKSNSFHNFKQRKYDFTDIERKLIQKNQSKEEP